MTQSLIYQDRTVHHRYDNWGPSTSGSAGLDLRTVMEHRIPAKSSAMVGLGVVVQIPEGHVGLLTSRSSTFGKFGLIMTNGIGIIDSDYRGELLASFLNTSDSPVLVPIGTRLAQLLVLPCMAPSPVPGIVNNDGTERGAGGFGSTG